MLNIPTCQQEQLQIANHQAKTKTPGYQSHHPNKQDCAEAPDLSDDVILTRGNTTHPGTNPVDLAQKWRHHNPQADPLGFFVTKSPRVITTKYGVYMLVDDKDIPGKESIFALKPTEWLHDAIITWWFAHWCDVTQGVSSYSTKYDQKNKKLMHSRTTNRIHGEKKVFFTSPYFLNYVKPKGSNQTQHIDIFTCSKMLIPVNVNQKHWVLTCINFDVGCSVVSGRPLRSRAVAGVSLHVCVCLGPVLASHATSLPAAAAAAWRGRGRVHKAGWSYGGVGPVRGLRGGGRRGWCEEWARRG
jgi:hypothetical protein